ncbi:hypothetical protein Tco_1086070 [Tanacetum coccineum]
MVTVAVDLVIVVVVVHNVITGCGGGTDGCNDDFRHRYGDLENGGDNGSRNACKALVKGGLWPESCEVVDSGAYMLIAVPLSIGGVVMIGRNKIGSSPLPKDL